jgi:predicted DsbA family dithiol-disulfide isomerase
MTIGVAPNTADVHRLVLWAQGRGSGRETATALFRAYFADSPNIPAPEGLVGCAAAAAVPGASAMK